MHSFSRFSWLLFLVFFLAFSSQAIADEKYSTTILEHPGLASEASGVCGEVLSASCGPRDEELPPYLESFKDVYIIFEEGNSQLYQNILEWNKLEPNEGELSFGSQDRWSELREQLDVLRNQVSLGGGVTLTKTSDKGVYCADLPPGNYVVGVWNNNNGGTWMFGEVSVKAGKVQKVDLLIPLICG